MRDARHIPGYTSEIRSSRRGSSKYEMKGGPVMTEVNIMKVSRSLGTLGLALAMFFAGTAVMRVAAQEKPVKLSHQQLNDLIKNAKEPADHEKLAAYYRQEAARLKQEAEEHERAAKMYAATGQVKPTIANGAPHCDAWAKLDTEAAKEAEALAVMHASMAKETH